MTRNINLGGGQYRKHIEGTFIENQVTVSDSSFGNIEPETSDFSDCSNDFGGNEFSGDRSSQRSRRNSHQSTGRNYCEEVRGRVINRSVVDVNGRRYEVQQSPDADQWDW